MFPKQRCSVCQNRAWEGTSNGSLILENHKLKERIEVLEITVDNLKYERKELLQEIKDKEEDARDLAFERDLARDNY